MPQGPQGRADGVFEGGGIKAIALAGAVAAAEEAGVEEWVNVAGTSAGAIVASLLAVGYTADELRAALQQTDFRRFADYGFGGRFVGGFLNSLHLRGYARGRYLREWLGDRFEEKLGRRDPTFADVVRDDLPSSLGPDERRRARLRLRLIASDITGGRMLVLPDDLEDFEDERGWRLTADDFPLVEAVRMSASLPFVFDPVRLYREGKPYFVVDGGLLSNFPVWLFDSPRPRRPTWGFRLHAGEGVERLPYRRLPRPFWQIALTKAMLASAAEAWDRRWVAQVTAVRTVSIPTGDIRSTEFDLTAKQADELYRAGYETAKAFFATAPGERYRNSFGRAPARRKTAAKQAGTVP